MTTEDKDNAVTPEFAQLWINNFGDLTVKIPSIHYKEMCQAYLKLYKDFQKLQEVYKTQCNNIIKQDIEITKLHEENTRLQNELNTYTSTDKLTAAKMYNMEMGLRHEVEKENARLQDIVDWQHATLCACNAYLTPLTNVVGPERTAEKILNELVYEVLTLTATNGEPE